MEAQTLQPPIIPIVSVTEIAWKVFTGSCVRLARWSQMLAVLLSYLPFSIAAILSCLRYTEFASDMPVAGSAFIYADAILGKFRGW